MNTKPKIHGSAGAQENETPKPGGKFAIEPDLPSDAAVSAAIHKFETGAPDDECGEPSAPAYESLGELPSTYGENALFLAARDPHWLFAYWDIDWTAFRDDLEPGSVVLRILGPNDEEIDCATIDPAARNWYLPALRQGIHVCAQIGYEKNGGFFPICRSAPAEIPKAEVSDSGDARFVSVPMQVSFQKMLDEIRGAMLGGESLTEALARLQASGGVPSRGGGSGWNEGQRRVLEALLGKEVLERISMGSGTIDQVLRRQIEEKLGSAGASEHMPAVVSSGNLSSGVTSFGSAALGASWSAQPFGRPASRSFFMHVNAEVIFYGGTDPDARVWIDGEEVDIRPDGTFRYHHIFPDGQYEIPVVAVSPDGLETRSATLQFRRDTSRKGEVAHSAQPDFSAPPSGVQ